MTKRWSEIRNGKLDAWVRLSVEQRLLTEKQRSRDELAVRVIVDAFNEALRRVDETVSVRLTTAHWNILRDIDRGIRLTFVSQLHDDLVVCGLASIRGDWMTLTERGLRYVIKRTLRTPLAWVR